MRTEGRMEWETATAHLSGQVWRQIVIVTAMVSALVAGVVAVADRTTASEPGVIESRLEAPPIDPSCRELLAPPKWGWVCEDRRP
jgi:anti-sigma-K factor RskA